MIETSNIKLSLAQRFRDLFNPILREGYITEKEAEKILSHFTYTIIEKGEVFCTKGQEDINMGILLSGLLCSYQETPKKNEEISNFFFLPETFVVTDFEAFTREKTSRETIIALEKSELLTINYAEVRALYMAIPKMNYIGRELAENAYVKALHRIYNLQILDAEGRVKRFFKDHPSFYNRVGKKEIASYLRMNRNLISKYFKPDSKK